MKFISVKHSFLYMQAFVSQGRGVYTLAKSTFDVGKTGFTKGVALEQQDLS